MQVHCRKMSVLKPNLCEHGVMEGDASALPIKHGGATTRPPSSTPIGCNGGHKVSGRSYEQKHNNLDNNSGTSTVSTAS